VTRWRPAIAAIASVAVVVSLGADVQGPAARSNDSSPHASRLVTVARGVTLELLDWGGSGRPLLLLAGSGHSAHVFDDFAPKLTGCCHVYGLTRRGHGLSSRPSSGYDDQQLADDVRHAIEQKQLQAPVLIGHSMAGGEMTTLGRQHSARLGGLVYLDAIGDPEDDPMADTEWVSLQRQLPAGLVPQPSCAPVDRSSFAAYRRTSACARGFALPESELRQLYTDSGGTVGASLMPGWVRQAIGEGQVFRRDYSGIRVPVLALQNGARTTEDALTASGYVPATADERTAIDRFMARSQVIFGRATGKLTRHVPDARIVYMPLAGHYLFLTREEPVLREIRAFVAALSPRTRPE
jgi:pimeloyl-ACP methyl ester carboxylesterase